ncbi:MAG: transketolase [Acidobacteria bacterium]|nr:MAG: transketolase [Acidobacteriota bacterium]
MSSSTETRTAPPAATLPDREQLLRDYELGVMSREVSLIGRKEVLTGKAKFGIFGDGKEVAQLALAHACRPGDWRAGYYRDQTWLMALGVLTPEAFFAQLYADPDVEHDPASGGRQMNAHFATRLLDERGEWLPQTRGFNVSADTSPTGSQMPRLVGLAQASILYRRLPELADRRDFSDGGSEVAFGTIGNASCAEGMFWEAVNAIGVLGAPAVISIWDDEYGISVPNEYQVTKGDLSALLAGFARRGDGPGYELYTVRGWDYPALYATYRQAADGARRHHRPALIHVVELTQPQGHSTSGSHERYKPPERLAWEEEHDCLRRMRAWLIAEGHAEEAELERLEARAKAAARAAQERAWEAFMGPIRAEQAALSRLLEQLASSTPENDALAAVRRRLERLPVPQRRHLLAAAREALVATRGSDCAARRELIAWRDGERRRGRERYSSHLYSRSAKSPLKVPEVAPVYAADAPELRGFEILNRCFDAAFARLPELVAFGEDVGKLGDVNQGFSGLQEKYGPLRIADTGIRECTILGQAIGLAMRGLRPIAEIQYLDYLHYALQTLSDDLATVQYRSCGGQKAPVIVRTRGHRLEGIWHSGSPMAGILSLARGVWLCVPRDMTRAAGMYNTLLRGDDPAIVVEVLNGYRLKERLPQNVGDFTVPLGVPEVLRRGDDLTLVTYGACCRIVLEAADVLATLGIEVEVIDLQTLLPFDRHHRIADSIKRTNRLLVVDEDVPGGASAYVLRQLLEEQRAFYWLDAEPRTLPAQPHRPAYGSDGDYFSKPNVEDVIDAAYDLMHEADPKRFPALG